MNAILNLVGGYSILVTIISSCSKLGVAISFFKKLIQLKKLILFNLINAKLFKTQNKEYKGGLSDYFKNKILSKVHGRNFLKVGVNNFFSFNENEQAFEKNR